MKKLKHLLITCWRIERIKFLGWSKCEYCKRWVREAYSILFTESGMTVCKKCKELHD